MMNHTIITIGRQFGSGGHEVGNRLAERLNIPLYDHNLIRMAARDLGISNEDAGRVDETRLGNVLSSYYIGMGDYTTFMLSPEVEKPLSDQLFDAQSAIIRKLAERGPGIFVGRCADYVLGDYSNVVNTFIYAYKDDRINRIMDIYKLSEKEAVDVAVELYGFCPDVIDQGPEEATAGALADVLRQSTVWYFWWD